MRNNSQSVDHSYDRVCELCLNLIRHALRAGLTETRAVRLPTMGWMSVYGGGGETVRRYVVVSFTVPAASVEPVLWVNAASRQMFKYVPGSGWFLVFERNQIPDDATCFQPVKPLAEVSGAPVETLAELRTAIHCTYLFVTGTNTLYRLNKASAEPQSLPDVVASDFGGRWERQNLSDFQNAFPDIGLGEAYGY